MTCTHKLDKIMKKRLLYGLIKDLINTKDDHNQKVVITELHKYTPALPIHTIGGKTINTHGPEYADMNITLMDTEENMEWDISEKELKKIILVESL